MSLGKYLAQIILEDFPLNEYSDKIINQLVDKFVGEDPNLDKEQAKNAIKRFDQIKNNLPTDQRDITKYSWSELLKVLSDNQPKRIKAGKINDGKPEDANLIYNQNGLRIYVGKTQRACIKYGNGYNFCISARGEDSMYRDYRHEGEGTPYFVFDDNLTSNRDANGEFYEPDHLLVVFVFDRKNPNPWLDSPYTVTTADNSGEDHFIYFSDIEMLYPKLKGLEKLFKPVDVDPKEKVKLDIENKIKKELKELNNTYEEYAEHENIKDFFDFHLITNPNKVFRIDNILKTTLNGELERYTFTAKLKPNAKKEYFTDYITQSRNVKLGNIKEALNIFLEFLTQTSDDDSLEDIKNDWDITYKKVDTTAPWYIDYLKDVKKIADKYKNELAQTTLSENLIKKNKKNLELLKEFVKFSLRELGIKGMGGKLVMSTDVEKARGNKTFGTYNPQDNKIWIYIGNRNMADICRTIAHELTHLKQKQDGLELDGSTGSDIENQANASAGEIMRKFGQINPMIYENKL